MTPRDTWSLTIALLISIMFGHTSVTRASFTDAEKKELLMIHNWLRETAFPTAAKMNFVTWSCKLEALAVRAATTCKYDHNYGGDYSGLGENIYKGFRKDPIAIATAWFSEKSAFDHKQRKCTGKECGHFFQVMSDATVEIGCGIRRDCDLVFCEYSAGNGIYTYGPPCSACPPERPLCLNNLCASSETVARSVGSPASASAAACRLACNNCGTRDTLNGGCKCTCSADATGQFCEKTNSKVASTAKCSPCTESPACLNGGDEDKADPLKCKCKCKTGFVGDRCEIAKDVLDNSVKLVIGAENEFKFDVFHVYPHVSGSLFRDVIWTILQDELSKAVNSFCQKDATNFVQCCPGKTFPGAAGVASKSHVKAADLKFTESSVGNTLDGSLNLLVHAVVTDSALCTAGGTSRMKRAAAVYVPQSVMASAIETARKTITTKFSGKLVPTATSCCQDIGLKEVKAATIDDLALGAAEIPVAAVTFGASNNLSVTCNIPIPATATQTGITTAKSAGLPRPMNGIVAAFAIALCLGLFVRSSDL